MATDPLGRELDRFGLASPLAETVRRRKDALVARLVSLTHAMDIDCCQVLNLACGPCVDVAEVLAAATGTQVSFVVVDQDGDALEYARKVIGSRAANGEVRFVQANVLRIRSPGAEDERPFDIVYSVGLLDYVPDRLARMAIRNWWGLVSPGGRMILTIKDRRQYDPTYYDWMMDWTFVPRTEEHFVDLLCEATGAHNSVLALERDATGVSVMAVMEKPRRDG